MANSKRQRILNYVRDTVMPAITTGGGYNFTIPASSVKRGLREIDAMPDDSYPMIYIAKADEERMNITRNQNKCSLMTRIVGIVKNSTGLDGAQEDLDDLIEDVTKVLESDRTLAQTGDCKWLEIKSVQTDDGDFEPFAWFAMLVEIVYVMEGVAP